MLQDNELQLANDEILVLRDCFADGASRNGMVWPESGEVICDDWEPTDRCGGGFHGLPWGEGGDYRVARGEAWRVVAVSIEPDNYRHGKGDLTDKCKFRRGRVVYAGDIAGAVSLIERHAPPGTRCNWSTQTAGDRSAQTAGDWSTQTAGGESTQTAGNWSAQTAGDWSTQTAGDRSAQTAGDRSTQKAGDRSTQKAGNRSTQKAGNRSTQKAGNRSTQTAGEESTQTAGDRSAQTAGDWSTQTAGGESTQTAGNWSAQTAGDWSTQTAGDRSAQKAGKQSVQITRWHHDTWRVAIRVVPPEHENRWCRCEQGTWRLATAAECEAADAKARI